MCVIMEHRLRDLSIELGNPIQQVSTESIVKDFLVRNAEYLKLEVSRIPDEAKSLEITTRRCLTSLKKRYMRIIHHNAWNGHPGERMIEEAARIIQTVLDFGGDYGELELLRCVAVNNSVLDNNIQVIRPIEDFFISCSRDFSDATRFIASIEDDLAMLEQNDNDGNVRLLLGIVRPKEGINPDYNHISSLGELLRDVKDMHGKLLEQRKETVRETMRQCLESIRIEAYKAPTDKRLVGRINGVFDDFEKKIRRCSSISGLDEIEYQMVEKENDYIEMINNLQNR